MAKIFKRWQKSPKSNYTKGQTKAQDLMDPILYNGGLDVDKYPILPREGDTKPQEEIENPLNKR